MEINKQKQVLKTFYNLKLIDSSEIKMGVSNMNYKIIADKGTYVLKRMNKNKKEDELKEELNYLNYLSDSKIPVVLPIKTEKGDFIPYESFILALYPFINHKTDQVSIENIGEVGKIIGKVNKLPINDLKPRPSNRFIWKELVEKSADKELVEWFLKEFQPYNEKFSELDLPTSIIHGDIWTGNVLFDKDNQLICVLDWESVDIHHRLFELGIVVIGCCYINEKLDLNIFNEFLRTYSKEIQLTDLEKEMFFDYLCYVTLWGISWRYVKFNIRKIDERFYDYHLLLLERYKNLKSLDRDKFYEQIKF